LGPVEGGIGYGRLEGPGHSSPFPSQKRERRQQELAIAVMRDVWNLGNQRERSGSAGMRTRDLAAASTTPSEGIMFMTRINGRRA
jgi:hypothetical protein